MNYIDKNLKPNEEDRTIGIIICRKENKFIMEYCSDDRILAKEYLLLCFFFYVVQFVLFKHIIL